jgi:acyl-CoA thioester hydrolase
MSMVDITYDDNATIYKKTIPVLVAHLNYGNHLGYDSLLSIIQDARIDWLKLDNMNEIAIEGSVGFLITDVAVSYKAEAFHGDMLEVSIYITDVAKRSFLTRYKVVNLNSQKVTAFAETKHIFYDFNLKKLALTPEVFVAKVNKVIS